MPCSCPHSQQLLLPEEERVRDLEERDALAERLKLKDQESTISKVATTSKKALEEAKKRCVQLFHF